MEALFIRAGLVIPAEHISVAYTRDLGAEGSAHAARNTPTMVELRLDLPGCALLDEVLCARLRATPGVRVDRRGTLQVMADAHSSRAKNLEQARTEMAGLIRRALDGPPPEPAVESTGPAAAPKRPPRGAGLIKSR